MKKNYTFSADIEVVERAKEIQRLVIGFGNFSGLVENLLIAYINQMEQTHGK